MNAPVVMDWRRSGTEASMGTQFTIGKLARAAGVPVSTVRYYEQRRLLEPEARTASSYRVYGPDSLKRLRFIRAAQASGFTLEDISMLLEIQGGAQDPCGEVQKILERRLHKVREQLRELTHVHGVLSDSIQWCRDPREAGCCQVIDELNDIADSTEVVALGCRDTTAPSTHDEIAGALFVGLRGSFADARLYVAMKRLLAAGKPVAPGELANVLGEPLDDILEALKRAPGIERDADGSVLGWGLTLQPTQHHFEVEGKELFTWCAFDTLFFPALLGRTVRIRSTCPASGDPIQLTVRPDGVEAVLPREAVVSIVLPESEAARGDVRAAFCNQVHYFRDRDAACDWSESHPGGILLPVSDAFQVGRKVSGQLLMEAGEA